MHFERVLIEAGALLTEGRRRLEASSVPAAAAALDMACYCRVKRLFDAGQALFFEGRLRECAVALANFAAVLRGVGVNDNASCAVAVDSEGTTDIAALLPLEEFFRRRCDAGALTDLAGLLDREPSEATTTDDDEGPCRFLPCHYWDYIAGTSTG